MGEDTELIIGLFLSVYVDLIILAFEAEQNSHVEEVYETRRS